MSELPRPDAPPLFGEARPRRCGRGRKPARAWSRLGWSRLGWSRLGWGCVGLALATLGGCEARPELTPSRTTCDPPAARRAPLRLLTRSEYDNTIRDLLGDDSAPSRAFPPEPNVGGFDNNAESHLANPLLVEQLTSAARELSQRAVRDHLDTLAPCPNAADADDCVDDFLGRFGKRAFRRPLTASERTSFLTLYRKAAPTLGYEAAIGLLIEAFLQSPQFLYRVEAPLQADVASAEAPLPLGPYELASRLAYFLWGSMPDDELLAAAEEGRLGTADELEAQARRLLADPRARAQVSRFHERWLGLSRFETVVRDTNEVPSERVNESWRRSLLAFVDDVFWSEDGTLADLFTSPVVFVDDTLAELYGLSAGEGSELLPVTLEDARAGLLTQPGLMAMLAHPNQSSPIHRGVFVREHILCRPVPAPPPSVNNTPPDPDPNATTRERFAVHTKDPACATCHQLIDPLGFGFEQFDELGRYRDEENGHPVDASGEVRHAPDPNLDGPFHGAAELGRRLADSSAPGQCLSRYWYRFALGRMDSAEDACTTEGIAQSLERAGGRLEEILIALVRSDAFRQRAPWIDELEAGP